MGVKRKRVTQKDDRFRRTAKQAKLAIDDCSVDSEVSDNDAGLFEVPYPGPQTYPLKKGRHLTFPTARCPPALPRGDGPKMTRFADHDVKITFIRKLGTIATHSNVFEVEIARKRYALKLFRTWSKNYGPSRINWYDPKMFPGRDKVAEHCKPFNSECRAYARVKERRIDDRYWKCYGYVRLPASSRKELYDITGLPEYYWQFRYIFGDRESKPTTTIVCQLQWPIYGLVKELGPDDVNSIDQKIRPVRTMLSDLKHLHKVGVINADVTDRNYIAGRLTDFSISLTLPHVWLDVPKPNAKPVGWPNTFFEGKCLDIFAFEDMIIASGVKTRVVKLPDPLANAHAHRTRSGRARMQAQTGRPIPLYELGVHEPEPSVTGSDSSLFSWQ